MQLTAEQQGLVCWSFIADLHAVKEIPMMELLGEHPALPIFLFHLNPDELPGGSTCRRSLDPCGRPSGAAIRLSVDTQGN